MSGIADALAAPAAVFSTVGIGFHVLSGCIKGFQLISTAFQVGKHAVHYRCAILLEEERLLLWAKHSGLVDDNLDPRLNAAAINKILVDLQDILLSTDKLSKRYKLDVIVDDPPATATPQYSTPSQADLSFLRSGALSKERDALLARAATIQKNVPLKRFWFAAADQAKFKGLLNDIRKLISGLYDLLSVNMQDGILQQLQLQRSEMLQATSQISELRALIEAYNLGDIRSIPEKTLALIRAVQLVPNPRAKDDEAAKQLQELMQEASQSRHAALTYLFGERISEVKHLGPGELRGSILYGGIVHYVEWKRYDWGSSTESRDKILDSINQLAMLLNAPKHPVFRTLDCVGIINEERNARFMYMYRWPLGAEQAIAPRTLHELLSSSFKPSLTDRFALARQLARALFYLYLANWMHKSFSSHNVLFFPESANSPRTLDKPYIVGFSYTRQDVAGEPSQDLARDPDRDIYRHPDCLEENYTSFHKTYDVYSLGLVLFEIVKWRPLRETFVRSARTKALSAHKKTEKDLSRQELRDLDAALLKECKVQDIKTMREDLLNPSPKDNHPADLAFRAGDNLANVVLTCLGPKLDEIRMSGDEQVLRETLIESLWKQLDKPEI